MLAGALLGGYPAGAQTVAPGPYYATPSWDQQLPAASRFVVLANWNLEAVLDRETGLVWQRQPAETALAHAAAHTACMLVRTGGRGGWRLPTVDEIGSLLDTTPAAAGSGLPIGHPFMGVAGVAFQTATHEFSSDGTFAVFVQRVGPNADLLSAIPSIALRYWCVRGGANAQHVRGRN
ncbi:Lcl domain-containing protein [Aquincola tertiaricarbonis]|uniref:Lcl domain-containing protein n=1 Tax=Aquincola tertiaricarbonis TaxID=391953 RepID=UPI0006152F40|nr:DUF1566 domain-containing protein [Aquincola tertiaricarbonis]